MFHFGYIHILAGSFAIINILHENLLLACNSRFLVQLKKSQNFVWSQLDRFLKLDIEYFTVCFLNDSNLGPLFLAYLAVNMPLNAFVVMLLIFGRAQGAMMLFISYAFIAQQLAMIWGMHLSIAGLTKRSHSSAKVLLHLAAHKQYKVGDFRSKLRLALAIYRLHTKNKYGPHYGFLGLVTMETFSKVRF